MVSVLLVMMTFSCLSLWGILTFQTSYENYALNSVAKMSGAVLLQVKYEAYFTHQKKEVCFWKDKMEYGERVQSYPKGISNSQPKCYSYNENGNINQAGTLRFKGKKKRKDVVLELGGGYFEVREIEDL